MMQLSFQGFTVEIFDEQAYTFGSVDNPRSYRREYRLDDEKCSPSSRHAVRVLSSDGENIVSSCILAASGGASGIHEHSAIIHGDSLILAVGPFMVSLHLTSLELNWKTKTDWATCFGVYHAEANQCYISHGELEVARVSYAGEIEWTQSGADILTNGFKLADGRVEVIDWNNDVYTWDITDGRSVPRSS